MRFNHDPTATLDYVFDWTAWLAPGETIMTATVECDDGIVIDSTGTADTKVTVWLSGGTVNEDYDVHCAITTTETREDRRHITIAVRDR